MKRLIIFLAALLLQSEVCSSADYTRHVSAENIIENRGGEVLLVPRSHLSRRIEKFAVAHGADPAIAPELAELLAACEHPRVLAAIAAKESNFNLRAGGKSGEVGAFQRLPRVWGHPGRTRGSRSKASARILQKLVSKADGKLLPAVRRYTGSGPMAVRYAHHIMKLAYSI